MSAFKSSDALALTLGSTYTLVISTFRGSTTPINNSAIPLGTGITGDFGEYTVCMPVTASITQVLGGGGEDCYVEIGEGEGEGVVEGAEGEPEGVVEGVVEGVDEGEPEGVVEGAGEGEPEGVFEGEGESEGFVEGEGELEMPEYSADYDNDGQLSLQELLRVIQLFNAGAYYCATAPDEESDDYTLVNDGLTFGEGGCVYHASDYREPFGSFQLSELLRTIQFFNLGGVMPCPGEGSEDGFCIPLS